MVVRCRANESATRHASAFLIIAQRESWDVLTFYWCLGEGGKLTLERVMMEKEKFFVY